MSIDLVLYNVSIIWFCVRIPLGSKDSCVALSELLQRG